MSDRPGSTPVAHVTMLCVLNMLTCKSTVVYSPCMLNDPCIHNGLGTGQQQLQVTSSLTTTPNLLCLMAVASQQHSIAVKALQELLQLYVLQYIQQPRSPSPAIKKWQVASFYTKRGCHNPLPVWCRQTTKTMLTCVHSITATLQVW